MSDKQVQICFYAGDTYAEWRGLPAMITYKDKAIRTKINRYFWSYGEKNGLKFPHDTITISQEMDEEMKNSEPGTEQEMEWTHINRENDDELGEIKFGENVVDDYLFDKPQD